MSEGLDVILRLMRGEVVTEKTEWYDLRNARCQLLPYTHPMPEVVVASSVTPAGGKAAGKYDLGMLCVAATVTAGYDALATNWKLANDVAAKHGRSMDASRLRLVGPMHIAETAEKAREDVRYGLEKWADYFSKVSPLATRQDFAGEGSLADRLVTSGRAVIGSPDDAIRQIQRLEEKQGHFGAFLHLAHNWAPFESTKKSYELFARHVLPKFNAANAAREASLGWVGDNAGELMGAAANAAMATIQKHFEEKNTEPKRNE
jgi:limonene 1,2-monooxygenase